MINPLSVFRYDERDGFFKINRVRSVFRLVRLFPLCR